MPCRSPARMVCCVAMPKLLLVLAMVLVQAQPWLVVLPCDRELMPMPASGAHAHSNTRQATPADLLVTTGQSDACKVMSACAVTAPAVVQVVTMSIAISLPSSGEPSTLVGHPAQAVLSPPFHPPSA